MHWKNKGHLKWNKLGTNISLFVYPQPKRWFAVLQLLYNIIFICDTLKDKSCSCTSILLLRTFLCLLFLLLTFWFSVWWFLYLMAVNRHAIICLNGERQMQIEKVPEKWIATASCFYSITQPRQKTWNNRWPLNWHNMASAVSASVLQHGAINMCHRSLTSIVDFMFLLFSKEH